MIYWKRKLVLNSSLSTNIDTIKFENETLTEEVSYFKKVVEKFMNGKRNFKNMMGKQRSILTRNE